MSLPIQPVYDIFALIKQANLSQTQTLNISDDSVSVTGDFSLETTQLAVKNVLDDISFNSLSIYDVLQKGTNNARIGNVLFNNVAVSANTTSTVFNMGDNDSNLTGKDLYNTIQISGQVPLDSSYNFVIEFSNDAEKWYSDHIEPSIKQVGNSGYKSFSLTRTNVVHRYCRVYNLVGSNNLYLEFGKMRN